MKYKLLSYYNEYFSSIGAFATAMVKYGEVSLIENWTNIYFKSPALYEKSAFFRLTVFRVELRVLLYTKNDHQFTE